jgi:hypothetical protein
MTSDSTFRTWGASIGNTMVALGLARASDTGQINWASVVRPGTTSTSAGFEMFVLTDTLQATYPVFIKMEYGTAGSTTLPMIWVTVGTGSNGAGTLTGVVGTRVFICPTTTSVTSYSSKWSGASNRIACLLCRGHGTRTTCAGSLSSGPTMPPGRTRAPGCCSFSFGRVQPL